MATHSSTLAWIIPWMKEPCRLQSLGVQRVGYDGAISLSLFFFFFFNLQGHTIELEMVETAEPGSWPFFLSFF